MGKSTRYSLRAFADVGTARIERLFLYDDREVTIRFRRTGIIRALELREDELLVLFGDAIARGVFSAAFLSELSAILDAQTRARYA